MVWHFTMLGNISSQTAWAIIRLSKPHTLRHEARDEIFQAPSPFFGGGAWVRGYTTYMYKPYNTSSGYIARHIG